MASDDQPEEQGDDRTDEQRQKDGQQAWSDWEQSNPNQESRNTAIESYIETGEVPEDQGLEDTQLDDMEAALRNRIETMVAEPAGIDTALWSHFVDESDLPAMRSMIMRGDTDGLKAHAQQVAHTVLSGNADEYLSEVLQDAGHEIRQRNGMHVVVLDSGTLSIAEALKSGAVKIPAL